MEGMQVATAEPEGRQLVTFALGPGRYGVPIGSVEEITILEDVEPVGGGHRTCGG